ncbi:hypothetical protein ISF_02332 [Cordyceps fumosorosea ARSEF 2679]|uniref:tRNA wybutosine-synthesizing protein 2 n=1 Tax=Cordyceps fumosorosea (strain ARSEF 2679) TaxID=1081104 RepID=A0A168BNY5_CORFA|nr:hypothetical protein ISF_02332 [Cordyceps fumosorosea ARSEF 2679]OAA70358.1 hypothetical protein ISF_02332 [Cordyceps fumosorosea ARSEF 2679]
MPKRQPQNPIQAAVRTWLKTQQPPAGQEAKTWEETLLSSAPKRFVIYEPLALLPSGSFSNRMWTDVLEACAADSRVALWTLLLKELSLVAKSPLTNLAINEGIPLQKDGESGEENVLRSPTGLRMLHGDFGPPRTQGTTPTRQEFDDAFWVSTKQNGIRQTWAPRWTMFSRGNVKEKARLLAFKSAKSATSFSAADQQPWAVDLYGGIGYFVFSYASLGMRVLCWEINPWSVEGLRRGARANGWGVKVVSDAAELARPVEELLEGGEQIVVFLEDNQCARDRILRLQRDEVGVARNVAHVNGGFLPTSEPTWEASWEVARRSTAPQTWLHLHENVGVHDIAARRAEIEGRFRRWNDVRETSRTVTVSHVEQVKTFAPGVWHCVFDVCIEAPQI